MIEEETLGHMVMSFELRILVTILWARILLGFEFRHNDVSLGNEVVNSSKVNPSSTLVNQQQGH